MYRIKFVICTRNILANLSVYELSLKQILSCGASPKQNTENKELSPSKKM